MKNKMTIILSFCLSMIFIFSSCGAKTKTENEPTEENVAIAQNDYAGAYYRMTQLQQSVKEKMEILENHNYVIQTGNPTDYWSDDGYFFVNFLPVYNENLAITSVLNEVDNFADIQTYITDQLTQAGYSNISVVKKEVNNYRVSYDGYFMDESTWKNTWGTMILDCIYDPSTNRFKVSEQIEFSSLNAYVVNNFYEFAELSKNKYALQNKNEKLYIECNDDNSIQYFSYSVLPEVEALNINSKMDVVEKDTAYYEWGFDGIVYSVPGTENVYVAFNENGIPHYFVEDINSGKFYIYEKENTKDENSISNENTPDFSSVIIPEYTKASSLGRYDSESDSIYKNISVIERDWVLSADRFEQTVEYENNTLSIMTTNPLTKEQNKFSVTVNVTEPETNMEESKVVSEG